MSRFSPSQTIAPSPLARPLARPPAAAPQMRATGGALLSTEVGVPSRDEIGKPTTILGFYVFMFAAPIGELVSIYLHLNSHIIMVWGALVLLVFLLAGRFTRFVSLTLGKVWLGLLALFLVAAVTGLYPRFSLTAILQYAVLIHILPVFFCGIAVTTRQVRYLMWWTVAGIFVVLFVCWRTGQYSVDYRFAVPDVEALANPNDLAFALLFGSTFLLLLLFNRSLLTRVMWLVAFPITIGYALKSGSRANLLTLMFMLVVIFLLLPTSKKLLFVLVMPLLAGFLSLIVPASTWQRLTLITMTPESALTGDDMRNSALYSQMARKELQRHALQLIVRHPLLGVGPLMFPDAVDSMVRSTEGHKSGWQNPHNVYLQIGAENGIPALVMFVASIVYCAKLNYAAYAAQKGIAERTMPRLQSLCLLLATLDFAFGILFCNVGYFSYLALLVGFTAANFLAVQNEMKQKVPGIV